MQSKHTYESVNTITWMPEDAAWGVAEDFRYAKPKHTGQKIMIVSLMIGLFFAFYNPMTTYKPEVIHQVEIELAANDGLNQQVNKQSPE